MTLLTQKDIDNIINLYIIEKLSAQEISKRYKISDSFIYKRILNANNIICRNNSECQRKYKLNENAFDSINEKMLYWCGFVYADACIYKNSVLLFLHEKDKEHLNKFLQFLESNYPLKRRFDNQYGISLCSSYIFKKLESYGITQGKSHRGDISILLKNSEHFWRGVIDGDGSIYIHFRNRNNVLPFLNLVGTKDTCTQFNNFIKNKLGISKNIRPHKSIFEITLRGIDALKTIELLYWNSSIYLNRKKERALVILLLKEYNKILRGRNPIKC